MSSEKKQEKSKLKVVSIKLREDQIENLELAGVKDRSKFYREQTDKWLDEATSRSDSREDRLLILSRRADMAEKELERLTGDSEYGKCVRELKAVDGSVERKLEEALSRLKVITDDTLGKSENVRPVEVIKHGEKELRIYSRDILGKSEHMGMEKLSELASQLTREQVLKIANMKSDVLGERKWFDDVSYLLSEYQVKAILNWRRNKIRKEAQDIKIEQARQRLREARDEVTRYYEETKKA